MCDVVAGDDSGRVSAHKWISLMTGVRTVLPATVSHPSLLLACSVAVGECDVSACLCECVDVCERVSVRVVLRCSTRTASTSSYYR